MIRVSAGQNQRAVADEGVVAFSLLLARQRQLPPQLQAALPFWALGRGRGRDANGRYGLVCCRSYALVGRSRHALGVTLAGTRKSRQLQSIAAPRSKKYRLRLRPCWRLRLYRTGPAQSRRRTRLWPA
ncbi:MAG: hypothetical protein IPM76_16520 [Chloroflexi bacterium]|nr:hypothetical protein [Chloroflexota bacterium]